MVPRKDYLRKDVDFLGGRSALAKVNNDSQDGIT